MDYYGTEPSSDFFAHYGTPGMKWGIRKKNETGCSKSSSSKKKMLYKKMKEAQARRDAMYNDVQKSILARNGFGKKAKAYREVNTEAIERFNDYYNSLNKKERERYRNRYLY